MNKQAEQQQRNQATMTMLEKMGQLADELLEEREEKQKLEHDWQQRRNKPETENETAIPAI